MDTRARQAPPPQTIDPTRSAVVSWVWISERRPMAALMRELGDGQNIILAGEGWASALNRAATVLEKTTDSAVILPLHLAYIVGASARERGIYAYVRVPDIRPGGPSLPVYVPVPKGHPSPTWHCSGGPPYVGPDKSRSFSIFYTRR